MLNVHLFNLYLAHQSVFFKNTNMKEVLNRISAIYEQTLKDNKNRLYIHLYNQLKNAIINRDLPSETYLPATRKLAEELHISRSTVNKSYELLVLEGYLTAKPGAGYMVMDFLDGTTDSGRVPSTIPFSNISDTGRSFLKNTHLINQTDDKNIAFRPGLPPLDIFPVKQWQRISNFYWRHCTYSDLSYHPSSGIEPLKKNLASYLNLSRNIKCDHKQIIIVSGSLQSLYLAASALINPGDTVLMENPTFPNVITLFKSFRAHIIPLAIDDQGAVIQGVHMSTDVHPKIIHVTPSGHYPSGISMSTGRKQEILDWADKHNAMILENDYEHEVSGHLNTSPPIFSLDKNQRTIYLGTFNRILHPSIRIGYMVVPYSLLETIEALQKLSHRFLSPSLQYIMNQFIEKKLLINHIKNLKNIALERKIFLKKTFQEAYGNRLTILDSPANKLHMLVVFPNTISEKKYLRILLENNIVAHPYSKCFIDRNVKEGMILGYASVPASSMRKKIQKMAKLLDANF